MRLLDQWRAMVLMAPHIHILPYYKIVPTSNLWTYRLLLQPPSHWVLSVYILCKFSGGKISCFYFYIPHLSSKWGMFFLSRLTALCWAASENRKARTGWKGAILRSLLQFRDEKDAPLVQVRVCVQLLSESCCIKMTERSPVRPYRSVAAERTGK